MRSDVDGFLTIIYLYIYRTHIHYDICNRQYYMVAQIIPRSKDLNTNRSLLHKLQSILNFITLLALHLLSHYPRNHYTSYQDTLFQKFVFYHPYLYIRY